MGQNRAIHPIVGYHGELHASRAARSPVQRFAMVTQRCRHGVQRRLAGRSNPKVDTTDVQISVIGRCCLGPTTQLPVGFVEQFQDEFLPSMRVDVASRRFDSRSDARRRRMERRNVSSSPRRSTSESFDMLPSWRR